MSKMWQLTDDEMLAFIARECLTAGVTDIGQWPVQVEDGSYGDTASLACNAHTGRDFGSGELLTVKCKAQLHGETLAGLRESLIQHLLTTKHRAAPFSYSTPAFTVRSRVMHVDPQASNNSSFS